MNKKKYRLYQCKDCFYYKKDENINLCCFTYNDGEQLESNGYYIPLFNCGVFNDIRQKNLKEF